MRFLLILLFPLTFYSQTNWTKKRLPDFENVFVEKITEDSLQSTIFIAIKKNVVEHYHKNHSECIIVLSGKAKMTLDGKIIKIKKGVQVSIPKETIHGVKVKGWKPLKVISIQSPLFDGKDRHFPIHSDF